MVFRRSLPIIATVLVLALFAYIQSRPPATPQPTATPTSPPQPTAMPTPPTAVPQWDEEPGTKIDPSKIYLATFKTEMGDIVIQLFADKAPGTVNNLVFLAREGFYDGTAFHRVMSDFMAQGGDPTGTGSGGPGYQFEDEINPTLRFDDGGYLAMANGGPNTNGSQFFILLTDIPNMAEEHTVFGQVTEGLDVAQSVTAEDTIETITIEEP